MGPYGKSRVKSLGFLLIFVVAFCIEIVQFGDGPAQASTPAPIGFKGKGKINELIYPTLGNPAIVEKGEKLTLEFDPRAGVYGGKPLPAVTDFAVSARSSNDLYPVTKSLPDGSCVMGSGRDHRN